MLKVFRNKTIQIEAMQLINSSEAIATCHWLNENGFPWLLGDANEPRTLAPKNGLTTDKGIYIEPASGDLMIRSPGGYMRAKFTDWIIRNSEGTFYPCPNEIFQTIYEEACQNDVHKTRASNPYIAS